MSRGPGDIQRKVLVLLMGGLAIGLSASPTVAFRIIRAMGREWEEINRQALRRVIRKLYESRLITTKDEPDGTVTLILSDAGKTRALRYQFDTMRLRKPSHWDGRWRVIAFDIPEKQKNAREAFRAHLRQLGLLELQKSIFVTPYPCRDEIEFLIEFFHLRPFVRQLTATEVDTDFHLRRRFGLST